MSETLKRWRHPLYRQAIFSVLSMALCVSVVVSQTHLWWIILIAVAIQASSAWTLAAFGMMLGEAHPKDTDTPHQVRARGAP